MKFKSQKPADGDVLYARPRFPMNPDDARIAARIDDYRRFLDPRDESDDLADAYRRAAAD